MRIRNTVAKAGAIALLLGAGWGDVAMAQGGEGNWQAERAALQAKVNQRVGQLIDQELTKQTVAKFLGLGWPVAPPTARKDEIVKRIEEEVEEEARAKFPEARRSEFAKEAEEKFRVFQPGDLVPEFQLGRTVGTNTIVREGSLYQVTEQRIRVGSRWLIRDDLTEEMQARFYEDLSDDYKRRYINVKNNQYNESIRLFKRDELAKRLPQALLRAGYFPRGRENMTSIDPNNWLARTEIVDMLYAARRKQLEANLAPRVAKEVFEASGYEFVAENKEWMPRNEAAAFRRRLAEEEAARRRAAAPDVDIFGPPPGEGGGGGAGPAEPPMEDIFD